MLLPAEQTPQEPFGWHAGAAPPQPSKLDAMKPDEIRKLLKSPHPECERGLAILWRQPRTDRPPAAPPFPDERLRLHVYPQLYARWAGLPREVVAFMGAELAAILGDAEVRAGLLKQGLSTRTGTPADLAKLIDSDLERWGRVVREARISAD